MDHSLGVIFLWCSVLREFRTIISAMNPRRFEDDYTHIFLEVWFEEFEGPLVFDANFYDCEPHGRELWFRAMKGEYGPIKIMEPSFEAVEPPRMLTYDN